MFGDRTFDLRCQGYANIPGFVVDVPGLATNWVTRDSMPCLGIGGTHGEPDNLRSGPPSLDVLHYRVKRRIIAKIPTTQMIEYAHL